MIFHIIFPFPPGESPVPPPSTVSSSALSTSAVAPPPQPKPGSSSQQDRKVPPPIGTERLARIRQTGSVNPPLLTTSYTASVGQGGIWSFGVGSASGKTKKFPVIVEKHHCLHTSLGDIANHLSCLGTEAMSGWSQPLMSSHMMHPQLQAEQSAFSQHQPMEQDDTGIANPANNYHQPQHLPNSYMDFPKVTQSHRSLDDKPFLHFWRLILLITHNCLFRGCPCQCMEEPCCPLILPWQRGQGGQFTMVCMPATQHGAPS